MFNNKLKSTLAKVASFVTDIETGITENDAKNVVLDEKAQKIADEKALNVKEIELGRKLLEKLQ